jgi:hypothetical protein
MNSDASGAPDYKTLFESVPGSYLVLDPGLRIVAASDAYLQATLTRRAEILGRLFFEVFAENPGDPSAGAIGNARASFDRVLQSRAMDTMGLQRLDVRRPESEGGGFEVRYWSAVNSPVLDPDGSVAYIVHRVENVTEFVLLRQQGVEPSKLTGELGERALRMEAEIYSRSREAAEAGRKLTEANEELVRLQEKARLAGLLRERQRAELSLLQSEERYRALFASMTEGFALHEILCDEARKPCDLRYLAVNPAFERHTGLQARDILGRTTLELFPDPDPVWFERYAKVAVTGEPAWFEAWFGPLGRWFAVSVFRSEPGRLGAVLTDITARRRAEEEMAWLASFPERNANPIAEIELATGVVRYVNSAGRRLFPLLLEQGFSHPWLAGLETVKETLAQENGDSVIREAMVGDHCYAQSVAYIAEKGRLRIYGIDITARKRAEEALRESEAALRGFFDSPGVMRGFVELVDGAIVHVSCNAAAAEMYGADRESIPGMSAAEAGASEYLVRAWVALYEESWRTGKPVSMEYARRAAGRRDRWLFATACHVGAGRSGNPRFAYTVVDLTDRKRMEEALRESEERYRMLFDTLIEGFCIIEVVFDAAGRPIDYRFLETNPAFEAQTGLKDARGRLMRDLAPDHEAHWFEIYGQVALTGEPARFVNEARALGRWYDVSAYRAGGPGSRRVAVLFNDITERIRAEETVRNERRLLQVTLTSIGDAVVSTDGLGNIAFLNPVAAALTGWTEEASLGRPAQDVLRMVNEVTREQAEDIIGRVLREGRAVAMANHTALVSRDGREIPIEDSAAPIRDEAGNLLGVVLVFHDVTERRRAQEALRESEARLTKLSDNLPDGAIYRYCHGIDGHFRFEFLSAGIEKLTGIPAAECIADAATIEESIVPEDHERLRDAIALSRERLTQFEVEVRRRHRATGEVRWSLLRSTPTRNPDGSTTWDGIELDITERQRVEEALRQNRAKLAERTVQLERTAAELDRRNREVERVSRMKTDFLTRISHELRTPLNAIVGYSDLLGEQSAGPLPAPYPRFVANIQEGASHLLAMVNDLLDISKIEAGRLDLNLESFRPAGALEEVLSVVTPLAKIKNIAIDNRVPSGMSIRADRTRFKQVLYNLLSNAVKFTPENGRVWISEAEGEDAAVFCVGDTGIGIPESELESVFDEFHRAGGPSGSATEGTGLGLAITRRLVELHGGAIHVESTVGEGSRFTFSFGPRSHGHPLP